MGVGMNVGLNQTIYTGKQNSSSSILLQEIRESHNLRLGYELDVILEYKFSPKISLQSGFKFTDWRYGTKELDIFYTPSPSSTPIKVGYTQENSRYLNIEIPLILNYYKHINEKQSFSFRLGVSPSIAVRNNVDLTIHQGGFTEVTPRNVQRNSPNFIGEIGFGYHISMTRNMVLSFIPNVRCQILGDSVRSSFTRRILFYGLSTQVSIPLSKSSKGEG